MHRFDRKAHDWNRLIADTVGSLHPLQRVIVAGLMTDEEDAVDEVLADRFGTTPEAVRIERKLASRRLREALYDRWT